MFHVYTTRALRESEHVCNAVCQDHISSLLILNLCCLIILRCLKPRLYIARMPLTDNELASWGIYLLKHKPLNGKKNCRQLAAHKILTLFFYSTEAAMEPEQSSPEGVAEREHRLPPGGCGDAAAVVDRLDEQLHASCGGFLPHLLPPSALGARLRLVSGQWMQGFILLHA